VKKLIGALVGVLALAVCGVAVAATVGTFSGTYTVKKIKSSSGFKVGITSSEDGVAGSKPSNPVRNTVLKFAPGSKIDPSVVPYCTASATEVQNTKGTACPAGSKIGAGEAEAITGFGAGIDPVKEDIVAYNRKGGLFLLLTPQGAIGQTAVLESKLSGLKLTTPVPPFCLPGGSPPACENGEAVLTKFDLTTLKKSKGRGAKKKNYITTPPKCTKKGWVTSFTVTYKDGTSETDTAKTACKTR